MIGRFLGDAFGVLSCSFRSTVLQCGARLPIHTLIKLLDRVVSGARFLTGGVFECDIAHRRSMSVLCMLYKNSRNPLNGALLGPYVPVRVTSGALFAHGILLRRLALRNLAVPHYFYSHRSVLLERSY